MGFWDRFKFATPEQQQRVTLNDLLRITKIVSWNNFQDLSVGIKRVELRQLYLTDDEITAATDTRMEASISTPWIIDGDSEENNDFITECLDPHIDNILSYSWWAVPYGYSILQVVWDNANKWRPLQVLDQPFEAFNVQRDGKIILANKPEIELLPEKFIATIRKPSWNQPNGEALFQRLYTPYFYRLNGWEFWIQFLESWGKPFLHAMLDGADQKTTDFVTSQLLLAKRPRGLATNNKVKIDVIEASGTGSSSFNEFQLAISERIQRLILGQTLTSGTQGVGSQALGNVHNDVRDDKRVSDCKLLEITVNKLIGYICSLNGIVTDIPIFSFQHTESLNSERAERDAILFNQGVRHEKKYYIENYDFTEDDFEVIEPPVAGTPQFTTPHEHLHFATQKEIINAQIATENAVIRKTNTVFTDDELKAVFEKSKSKAELEHNLALLMGKDSGEFEENVTKGNLMANVEGFVHGSTESD